MVSTVVSTVAVAVVSESVIPPPDVLSSDASAVSTVVACTCSEAAPGLVRAAPCTAPCITAWVCAWIVAVGLATFTVPSPMLTAPPLAFALLVASAATTIAALGAFTVAPARMRACAFAPDVMVASADEIETEMAPTWMDPEVELTVFVAVALTDRLVPPPWRPAKSAVVPAAILAVGTETAPTNRPPDDMSVLAVTVRTVVAATETSPLVTRAPDPYDAETPAVSSTSASTTLPEMLPSAIESAWIVASTALAAEAVTVTPVERSTDPAYDALTGAPRIARV